MKKLTLEEIFKDENDILDIQCSLLSLSMADSFSLDEFYIADTPVGISCLYYAPLDDGLLLCACPFDAPASHVCELLSSFVAGYEVCLYRPIKEDLK